VGTRFMVATALAALRAEQRGGLDDTAEAD